MNLFTGDLGANELTPGIELITSDRGKCFLVGTSRVHARYGFNPRLDSGALLCASFGWIETKSGRALMTFGAQGVSDDGQYVLVLTGLNPQTPDIGCHEECVLDGGATIGLIDEVSGDALICLPVGGCVTYFLRSGQVFRLCRNDSGTSLSELAPDDVAIAHCTRVERMIAVLPMGPNRTRKQHGIYWLLFPLIQHFRDEPAALGFVTLYLDQNWSHLPKSMRDRMVEIAFAASAAHAHSGLSVAG